MIISLIYFYVILGSAVGWQANNVLKDNPPVKWSVAEHQANMRMCNGICKNGMLSYEPFTGECSCQESKSKRGK